MDSYTGQVAYADIPEYRSTKLDPESKAPIGFYELRDALDWRPRVDDQTAATSCPFAQQRMVPCGLIPVHLQAVPFVRVFGIHEDDNTSDRHNLLPYM